MTDILAAKMLCTYDNTLDMDLLDTKGEAPDKKDYQKLKRYPRGTKQLTLTNKTDNHA